MPDQPKPTIRKITASDSLATSADVVAANIAKLKALFPELLTEGENGASVNIDVLKQLVGDQTLTDAEEKFGLNWHGKRQARQLALTPSSGTLRPCPDESVEWDTTQNVFIEGDNLEVLKLLQKSYANRVALVFIDPPYNTGADFVYPDDYSDGIAQFQRLMGWRSENGQRLSTLATNSESSGRFHTRWLSMMMPRLRVAQSLLATHGFIAITIDDTEVGHLRLLCDEVFGPENFIANLVWQKKYTRANDATFFSANHDHILVYAKSKADCSLGRVARGDAQVAAYANPDEHPKGPWKATPLHARSGSNTSSFTFKNGVVWAPPPGTYRRFSDKSMRDLEADNAIWFGSDGKQVPSRKSFLSEMDSGMVPVTIWDHEFAGHNHAANDELKALKLGGAFTSPKPTKLLSRLLEIGTQPQNGDIVLDFFAGSGTTGHALFLQNAADKGNRRLILVQLPEPVSMEQREQRIAAEMCSALGKPLTIAELTKERLRRAGAAVKASHPMFTSDTGFRVYRLDDSCVRAWSSRKTDLDKNLGDMVSHLREGRTADDLMCELLLKRGLDLCVPIESKKCGAYLVHSVGAGSLFACLAPRINREDGEAVALGIAKWHKELRPAGETAVVFRDDAFGDDVVKTNVAAILEQNGLRNIRSL